VRILVLGSGGREHALAWRLLQDPDVSFVLCAPGNPGMATLTATAAIDPADPLAVADLVRRERIDLTVVGPELPLSRGIVDHFDAEGLAILGPTRAAADLECSKAFAKAFMARHGVPTARYVTCESESEARDVLASGTFGVPVVLKADGLAAGKGVVVATDRATAEDAVTAMMRDRRFGDAGARLVIEECLTGPELSFFVLSDGERVIPLGSAQDHKRAFDDDEGPNTGGMGAFAPSPLATPDLAARILREVVAPVIAGMRAEGHPYRGFLYCGLMLTPSGPRVIEFNVRFGDPEAQVVLPLVEGNLAAALAAAARGDLRGHEVTGSAERAVGVVLASGGYPDAFETGQPIAGTTDAESQPGVTVFHAGTGMKGGVLVTAGGRVMTVVGRAASFESAMARAYAAAGRIVFDGRHMRTDIGRKALQ